MSTPAWMNDAACAAKDKRGLPWTSDTGTVPTVLVDLMQETCAGCPVRAECATYANTTPTTGGWWAGLDRAAQPADLLDLADLLNTKPVRVVALDSLGGAA